MKIAIVASFYSEGMGYTENCLSRALVELGHGVHVVASTYNVYGNEPLLYDETYASFLGPRQVAPQTRTVDGYTLHQLPASLFGGYVAIKGLRNVISDIAPDVVDSLGLASLQTFELAALKPLVGFKLFAQAHQTMSAMRPYMREPNGQWLKRAGYRLTRTLPTYLASLALDRCYAATPDCAEVARRFYGVPEAKIKLLSIGADTETFRPIKDEDDRCARAELRGSLGFGDDDIVCLYTGRFTEAKNPLLLAQAIDFLGDDEIRYQGLFIGDGAQRDAILRCRNTTVIPFMTHRRLAEHYRAVDIGVWPRQESMSMIDAASSALPIVVSDRIGEPARVTGNGLMYEENSVPALASAIQRLRSPHARHQYGDAGRDKVLAGFNWRRYAQIVEHDFQAAMADER